MMPRILSLFLILAFGLSTQQVSGQVICYDDNTGEMHFTSLVGVSSISFESKTPIALEEVAFTGEYFHGSTQLIGDIFVGTTGSDIPLGIWDSGLSLNSFGPVTISYGDGSLGSIDIQACAAVPEPGSLAILLPGLGLLAIWSRRRK